MMESQSHYLQCVIVCESFFDYSVELGGRRISTGAHSDP